MTLALSACLNIADLRERARALIPKPIFDFVDGGGEDEQTLSRNRAAFGDWGLVPQVMRDVSRIELSTRILGQPLAWPFLVGPTGMPALVHSDGEIGIARAAAAVGALYCLSTMATQSIEDVASAVSAPKVFQLYIFRDRGISRELIQRARAAGYVALMLTVDVQIPANRERDRRSGMVIPPRFGMRSLFDFAHHPRWCWDTLVRHPMKLANFAGHRAGPGTSLIQFINEQYDPSISWKDLEWVAEEWGGPVAIKGVMSVADAEAAVQHGAQMIVLSNHGGRQLDGGVAPMDMLPRVVEKLGGRAEVVLDGGIRRATDMLKALALGANACMSGRIGLFGLGAGGSAGAATALRILRDEFVRDLALLGIASVNDIDRLHVMRLGHDA